MIKRFSRLHLNPHKAQHQPCGPPQCFIEARNIKLDFIAHFLNVIPLDVNQNMLKCATCGFLKYRQRLIYPRRSGSVPHFFNHDFHNITINRSEINGSLTKKCHQKFKIRPKMPLYEFLMSAEFINMSNNTSTGAKVFFVISTISNVTMIIIYTTVQ